MMEQMIPRRSAAEPWPLRNGMGNHRIVVKVDRAAEAAVADVMWRRRDLNPEQIGVRVVRLEDGLEVKDVVVTHCTRERGRIAFRALTPGEYAIYYMPMTITGPTWYFPETVYMKPEEMAPDPAFLDKAAHPDAKAEVLAIESRKPFESFDPMEVPATEAEARALLDANPGDFILFPEDREHPVRMFREFPARWAALGAQDYFHGEAARGEYYCFQIAVYARAFIEDLRVSFRDLPDGISVTCFNAGGTDWLGRAFQTQIALSPGDVRPLWFGVDLPDAATGLIRFAVDLHSNGCERCVSVTLDVSERAAVLHGDGNPSRFTRMRWLNSTIGLDEEVPTGWEPVSASGDFARCVGRAVRFDGFGLPCSIRSHFSDDGLRATDEYTEVLASPVRFEVTMDGAPVALHARGVVCDKRASGTVLVTGGGECDAFTVESQTHFEYDGHLDTLVTLRAARDLTLDDVSLYLPYRREVAKYMVGFGREGGLAPETMEYAWSEDYANNMVWYGTHNAGLQIKLKHTRDVWELFSFKETGLPDSWANDGKGDVRIAPDGDAMVLRAKSGARSMKRGEALTWRFALLITPVKKLRLDEHWRWRHYHPDLIQKPTLDYRAAKRAGAAIVNLHQGGDLNAWINYPFLNDRTLREQANKAHALGLKLKIYYTIRELSNHAAELPALLSLGGEIFRQGPTYCVADHFNPQRNKFMTGGPWMCEHLVEGFVPAWQQILSDGDYDSALATTGLSRWHNYYLEGLKWLIRQVGMDGLYLDGVGYDREIMKRVRKTMDRAKPGCLIDFHSGNSFAPEYGMNSPINCYMELLPSLDSLWLGEMYDYEGKSPDYWLVEVSGLPFGLTSEMLQDGGNPWRGMLFGMSCRAYGDADPTPLWKFWASFGMEGSHMLGWWNPECPVRTGCDDVKATAYVKEGQALVAIASWAPSNAFVAPEADHFGAKGWFAPAIEGIQPERTFAPGEKIPIVPRRGWLLVALD